MNKRLIWFKVDRATIFLRSLSIKEKIPEYSIVNPDTDKILQVAVVENLSKNFQYMKIPAATSVLLCTNAEMGVGAAIAAGSHEENGNWALLVKIKTTNKTWVKLKDPKKVLLFKLLTTKILLKKRMSPTRFV